MSERGVEFFRSGQKLNRKKDEIGKKDLMTGFKKEEARRESMSIKYKKGSKGGKFERNKGWRITKVR